ncbi:MAG: hypothetical protein IJ685_10690 [Selenomonadaceae bacterium]|nr:hypothetical protein [Selenomonadaceae bacterium]
MTDTFFDLQRFADPAILKGTDTGFVWANGEAFVGGGVSTASVGTQTNPAYWAPTGSISAIAGAEVYLTGKDAQNFSIGKQWSMTLGNDTLQVTRSGDSLALGTWQGDMAVLAINGEYNEAINGNEIYIKTAQPAIVSLNAAGYTLAEGADGVLIGLNNVVGQVNLSANVSNVSLATSTDTASASILGDGGYDFEKSAQVFNTSGNITIFTNDNTITMPNDDVWDLKVTDSLLTGPAEITANSISKATGGATLTTSTGLSGFTVNGTTWNEISGELTAIEFDSVGAATVDNTGEVVVDGADGAKVTVKNLDSATVNDIKVTATGTAEVGFALEEGGISAVTVQKGADLTVNGDTAFDVNVGKNTFNVATGADKVSFEAGTSYLAVEVEEEKAYTVTGGNVTFVGDDGAKSASLNGAAVSVSKGGILATTDDSEGIDDIAVGADTKVSVSGDSNGFTASYAPIGDDAEHTFEVNGASIGAEDIEGQNVDITFGTDGSNVTVTGLTNTDDVSVAGGTAGMTYHFKNEDSSNAVKVAAGETLYVTLDGTGAVTDFIDEANYKKLQSVEDQWENIATVGSEEDTVAGNKSDVYTRFYNLGGASAINNTLATFANEDSTTYDTVSNPNGIEIRGSEALATAGHVTLTAGSNVGAAPINIQADESDSVFDVVLDLTGSTVPSTVAIGTEGVVDASHEVHLSNAGGYAYLGALATGQNRIFAGTAGAQIRHDGTTRATIAGNRGNDTIWGGANDIVTGGAGADAFYDTASYTIKDYDATQGDVLIATRIDSVSDITKENIRSSGNQIGFGTGNKMVTIGDDQSDPLFVKVAVMDTNADIVGSPRNVALAGINGGALDASGLDAAALILADSDRNGASGDNVTGTSGNDTIYVGANDTVNGGAGNDSIIAETVSADSGDAGITVVLSAGKDTISGWTFGFDKNAGATELIAGEGYQAEFDNDRLKITDSTGSILLDDTSNAIEQEHGEAKVLINGTKWMAIRTDDESKGYDSSYGDVASNDEIADFYIAEREGRLVFGEGVTENLGEIHLSRYYAPTNYQDITYLELGNNSKADVYGTSGRETVAVGGSAEAGANKRVSLGAGNDVIISGGDGSVTAGHTFYFGASDGLDTINNFSHNLGTEIDPDNQYADTIVLEKYGTIYTGTGENGGSRIDFVTDDNNRVSLFEGDGISVDKVYQIKIGDFDTKLAKIGNSSGANTFTYASNVDYYVGSSADNAQDTLNVGNEIANANIWLDGTNGTADTNADEQYYRGIAVVNASAETNTNVSLAGNGNDNTLYGGGAGTNNYLWGGAGNNVLIGSEDGQDTFFYVRNAGAYLQGVDDDVTGGNDTVQNYDLDKGDIVWLGDTTLDDIASTEVNDSSVVVNFKNGGSLTVEGSDDVRFLINSGTEAYVTDKDSESDNKWTKEA